MDAPALRHFVYTHFRERGTAPSFGRLAALTASARVAEALLRQLHDEHALVLEEDGRTIRMALPFAARPSGHAFLSGDQTWQGNCAWDALGLPVLLGTDGTIESRWSDTGEDVRLEVVREALTPIEGFAHFTVPARSWWDNIVFT